ncbi:hypothetical protein [Haladaptatus halobius]|uniref:hypothetical protein n=1 Tax=Haladaptatus halobius TaxID=2884875 RepID=UPI001D0B09BD|nr:hypothetical protein [Haladaptatus halobius]
MVLLAVIKTGFGVAGLLTLLIAGHWGIVRQDHRRALRIGAFVILWLAAMLLNGWQNILTMAVAMGTLVFVWFLTQRNAESSPQ